MKHLIKPLSGAILAAFAATAAPSVFAQGKDLKVALIAGKTGPLEAYAKETEVGFMMGLEYLTNGTMAINGRRIKVIVKDDQSKPDLGRTLLAEAYGDDKVDLAVGTTSSGSAIAMLPVAKEYKKVLIVEPAVADAITQEKWNKYIFRTARSSMQDALAAASTLKSGSVGFLAQDYAFGRDAIEAGKEALGATGSKARVVHEEYAPATTTDFTASAQRLFNALKDKPQPRVLAIVWAGPNPMNKIADMKPERYGIALVPGGNILPVMKTWKSYAGTEGTIYYYYAFPKNKMNDWFVAEHTKRYKMPPDMFTAGGMAAASAVHAALSKAPNAKNGDEMVAAMEGLSFETPKGKMTFRKEDHQAIQPMYHFRIKKDQKTEWDLLELVREIPATELPLPVRNKR
ncbi:substrate-binding domain-containing protein [Massilia yuzhufengensis]|uniref:Amino acid/amide ABC transporter substrate-binding protein, HAAT family n=1 Tax=Massilia yuzhufengensis TaxID=1164594 RepID=A0A1I1F0W6_9BURK|nr:substrate-binding domain-containing protein [Massilia yuzhufengensis]SFB90803.1 amino acid/amide ABC transporter substrate-binding protein, HAAT family [Massilia yuzhufengensis]